MFGKKKTVSDVMREVKSWQQELQEIAENSEEEQEVLKKELEVVAKEAADARKIGANLTALLGE